jgi:Xaa-Pro aminopeptidase
MLTAEGCRARRARLWEQFEDRPDWILIFDPQHLMYFANYYASPFVFRTTNSGAVLILGADGSSTLVADSMLAAFTEHAHVDEVVAPVWYRGKETAPHREALLIASVQERLKGCAGSHFGMEMALVPTGIVESLRENRAGLRLTPVDAAIHEMKRAKDADEIALMLASIKAGEAGFAAGLREIKPGMSELDAYLLVQQAVVKAAGMQVHMYGDFVSGPRCEKVGGPPSDRVIERGDLVILDFSVVVAGYRGDFANTFVCGAPASGELRRLQQACVEALSAGERLVRAGTPAREIDRAVRDSFAAKHLAENFRSHSGHGIGLGHPDPPYLVPESSDVLVAGDIIAIEPGQYIDGLCGMRYEHNFLVTAEGCERLTQHELSIEQVS